MVKNTDYTLQDLDVGDEPFLWEMLFQAIYVAPHKPPLSRDILRHPKIAGYVKGWGKAGDIGFKAQVQDRKSSIGAIWVRSFTQQNKGYGYINDDVPELSMSIIPEFRNRGLGTILLRNLFSRLSQEEKKLISLSVSLANPARRLYKRHGFMDTGTAYDNSITMIRAIN